ncbi:MAG: GTPase HflX [Oscillospiraceae bacterium]|jgi:GTP-binding protein HflX|nr:GTPase HflX [Oscillospiraceae bacterium]
MENKIAENIEPKEKAVLVALDSGEYDADVSLRELEELAVSVGAETAGQAVQKRDTPDPKTFIGMGKLEEIKDFAESQGANLLIFDSELSAAQVRNIEEITGIRTIDRTMLILDIFSRRALSSEGRLQVELAQLRYMLPRLRGAGQELSRQGGGAAAGIGARRGAGETRLETDRRRLRRKIAALEEELSELEKRREDLRKRRKKNNVRTVALFGYTNVGKSTLLNALTDSDVYADDKLFATLDPTARKLELPDGRTAVLIDTVGLVRRLPHHLVEAFKSTLEETASADLILNVCDASSVEACEQAEVAERLLEELGAGHIPLINVLNKCDVAQGDLPRFRASVMVSAKTGQNLDLLLEEMSKALPAAAQRMKLLIPYGNAAFLNKIRLDGKVFSENFSGDGIEVDALVEKSLTKSAMEYKTNL